MVGLAHLGVIGSDEQGAAILKYDKGEIADLTYALRTDAVDEAYIYGTEGYIKIDELFAVPTKAKLVKGRKIIEVIEEPIIGNALNYEAQEVMNCLKNGLNESIHMPLNESIEIMQIMDNIRKPWNLTYQNDLKYK